MLVVVTAYLSFDGSCGAACTYGMVSITVNFTYSAFHAAELG